MSTEHVHFKMMAARGRIQLTDLRNGLHANWFKLNASADILVPLVTVDDTILYNVSWANSATEAEIIEGITAQIQEYPAPVAVLEGINSILVGPLD